MSLAASLFQAVTKGDRKLVASLLASGADVNSPNEGGQTPIILAIISGHDHILRMLLDFGADPFLKDQTGLNAIDWAQRKGRTDLVRGFQKDTQPKPSVNNAPPPSPSADRVSNQATVDQEKSRRYIAGLRRRFEERPARKPVERERHRTSSRDPNGSTQPEESEIANPQTERSIPAYDTPKPVRGDQPKNRIEKGAASNSEPKATDQAVEPNVQSTTETSPTRSRSARKRCPQCNTIYHSDLLTYCAYHVVPLVDADAPVVIRSESSQSSLVLWTLVLVTLFATAIVTAYVTGHLFGSNEKRADATSQSAHLQGIPAAKGGLAQKAVLLPVAEAPLNATKQTETVEVSVKVNRLGQVIDTSSSSENQILRESALAAAKRATFSAEKLNNRGATGIITYTFNR